MDKQRDHDQSSDPVPNGSRPNPWRFKFPNTADFNFNYWKLLNDACESGTAIAQAGEAEYTRIAIIGAGVAGLTFSGLMRRRNITDLHRLISN